MNVLCYVMLTKVLPSLVLNCQTKLECLSISRFLFPHSKTP